MASHISRTINSAFYVSREKKKRKKNDFIRQVFLTLVKNYSQGTALFYFLIILPLLVLDAVKRKPSSLFRSWGSAPSSSNTESLSSEESSSYLKSCQSASEIPDEDPSSSCGTSLSSFRAKSNRSPPWTACSLTHVQGKESSLEFSGFFPNCVAKIGLLLVD